MRSINKRLNSWGPGGIVCNCCRPPSCSKKDARHISNRLVRRHYVRVIRAEREENA